MRNRILFIHWFPFSTTVKISNKIIYLKFSIDYCITHKHFAFSPLMNPKPMKILSKLSNNYANSLLNLIKTNHNLLSQFKISLLLIMYYLNLGLWSLGKLWKNERKLLRKRKQFKRNRILEKIIIIRHGGITFWIQDKIGDAKWSGTITIKCKSTDGGNKW